MGTENYYKRGRCYCLFLNIFCNFTMLRVITSQTSDVLIFCFSAASLPDFWVPQPKDQNGAEKRVHLVSLLTTSEAYQKVQTKFNKTCGKNILKIEQIQNPALYKTFAVRKEKMEEGGGSNEMLLFHGTAGENVSNINHHGFNRSYSGKNGKVIVVV